MKKVLIIGGSGFIGKNVREYLENKKCYEIHAPTTKNLNAIDEEQVANVLRQTYYDIVLNFAVYGDGVDKTKDGSKILEYNLRIFLNFEKNHQLYGRMFYAGTGAEYDKRFDIRSVKESEEGKHIPIDQYGLMRYITDRMIRQSENIYSLKLFGIFGKYEPWHIRFISNCCCKAIKGIPISIRQNVYFDYIWIEDFCKILDWFMNEDNHPQHHAYNVTRGEKVDLLTIAKMVVEISGKQIPIIVCHEGIGKEYTSDNQLLLQEIGGFRFTPLKAAIHKLYVWYQNHENEIDLYKLLYQN